MDEVARVLAESPSSLVQREAVGEHWNAFTFLAHATDSTAPSLFRACLAFITDAATLREPLEMVRDMKTTKEEGEKNS